jgi:excisionase family DNA binding protein
MNAGELKFYRLKGAGMGDKAITGRRYGIVPELAKLYRTSPAQIYQWIAEGRIPPKAVLRIGKKILVDLDALEEWATAGGSPASRTNTHTT